MNPHKNYLSPKEYEIMTIFWSIDKPLTVSEVLQHRKEGTWSANSIHPLLNKLLENGYIGVCGSQKVAKVNSRLYEAKISLSDYVTNQVSEVFDNETNKFNVSSFLSGLLGGDKENDKEIISELEKWLDDYCKKDDRWVCETFSVK